MALDAAKNPVIVVKPCLIFMFNISGTTFFLKTVNSNLSRQLYKIGLCVGERYTSSIARKFSELFQNHYIFLRRMGVF